MLVALSGSPGRTVTTNTGQHPEDCRVNCEAVASPKQYHSRELFTNGDKTGEASRAIPPHAVPNVYISRFKVIPKSPQMNKWRLSVDLSFPADQSVNDGIPKELCFLKYVTGFAKGGLVCTQFQVSLFTTIQ